MAEKKFIPVKVTDREWAEKLFRWRSVYAATV